MNKTKKETNIHKLKRAEEKENSVQVTRRNEF